MRRPRVLPPVYLLLAVIGMIVLNRLVPGMSIVPKQVRWVGWIVMAGALAWGVWAATIFARRRTPIRPGSVPSTLVAEGPFRVTRNPMYLGMVLFLIGLAVKLGSLTPWLMLPAFVWAIARNIIPVEEAMLEEAFGDAYRQYQASVRRWL